MRPFSFPGTYEDEAGAEPLSWHIGPSARPGRTDRYEIRTRIRGVDVAGADFDGLEPDGAATLGNVALALTSAGELTHCVLSGDLPCTVAVADERLPTVIHFALDLRDDPDRPRAAQGNLELSTVVHGRTYGVTAGWFEDGTLRLDDAVRPGRLVCCVTCLYSDYSPAGHGLMGMRCHRDAKDLYLAVRTKNDYWPVPVTEDVPETYLCDEYRGRVAGTGYRG